MLSSLQIPLRRNGRILATILFAVLACAWPGRAQVASAEVIRKFDSQLTVTDPATLEVVETIEMDFQGAERRGIFRHIPYRYQRGVGGLTNAWRVDLDVQAVTDEGGNPRPHKITHSGGDLIIRIGDPDVFYDGRQTYVITYTARRAIPFFEGEDGRDYPEVVWNVTGHEWPFAIEEATATLHLPAGVSTGDTSAKLAAGRPGNDQPLDPEAGDGRWQFRVGELQPGSGMSLAVQLPPGSVQPVTWQMRLWWIVRDWWPAVVLPLLTLGSMLALWNTRGRDEQGGQAIAVEWDPPRDLAPAEVGTLYDEVCHTQDVIATILDLAARGYITIEQTDSKAFLGLGKQDYTFRRKRKPKGLPAHEKDVMDGLFTGTRHKVKLSELRGEFHTTFRQVQADLYESLTERDYFTANPNHVRSLWITLGVLIAVTGLVLAFVLGSRGMLGWGVGILLAGVPMIVMGQAMPARTTKGSTALRECMGFRRFLMMVEKDRLAEAYKQDPTIFGRLLPYAMVLGVEDRWAEQFDGLLDAPPSWFKTTQTGRFSSTVFLADLGHGVHSLGSNLTAVPASTGSGGGSSAFSGGGGFSSGGGFGGGGGGSW